MARASRRGGEIRRSPPQSWGRRMFPTTHFINPTRYPQRCTAEAIKPAASTWLTPILPMWRFREKALWMFVDFICLFLPKESEFLIISRDSACKTTFSEQTVITRLLYLQPRTPRTPCSAVPESFSSWAPTAPVPRLCSPVARDRHGIEYTFFFFSFFVP